MLNIQLMPLSTSSTDEVMSGTGIKQDNNGVSVWRKRTHRDLLALGNILYGCVVDAASPRNGHLWQTMWRMGDVALRGILLRRGTLLSEVARATIVEAGVTRGGPSGQWCRQVYHRWRWG
jgi:hypothetical protein